MRIVSLILLLLAMALPLQAQETKSLFGEKTDVSFIWGMETKTTHILDDSGTTIGLFGGALFDRSFFTGLAFGSNMTHPEVNYSYLGILGQYTHNPRELYHWSAQLFIGRGTTKDYEHKKSSTMDNFGNTSGPGFNIVEPGVNAEVNLHEIVRLVAGLSYRYASGLDEDDPLIQMTKVESSNFSGFHFNMGLKIGKY